MMSAELVINVVSYPADNPDIFANATNAQKLIDLYRPLIEKLAAEGGGDGSWSLLITSSDDKTLVVSIRSGLPLGPKKATRVVIDRVFSKREAGVVLSNDLFVLGDKLQGKGLANLVNKVGAEALEGFGGKVVTLHANLETGGYAWLRKGVWPNGGAATLDKIVDTASKLNLISPELSSAWFKIPKTELRQFVLSDAFQAYKPAFLGSDWQGKIDLSKPELRAAFTGVNQVASKILPTVASDATANEIYRDAVLRHQIGLRRYSAGLAKKVAVLLEEADKALTAQLNMRLADFTPGQTDFTSERWKALLSDIRDQREAVVQQIQALTRGELPPLSVMEGAREVAILEAAIPIRVELATIAADQLRAIITSKPFHGRLLKDWFMELKHTDQSRLIQALQIGMVQGEPITELVRRIIGTRANAYADGILAITRRDANTIVRTAVNHVSNTARSYVWDANEDIIQCRIWTATLDGRTSAMCRARDGHGAPVGNQELPEGVPPLEPPDATPPGHMNCRSTMVAYINGVGVVGHRPTVTDTRTRRQREIDFRKQAKAEGKTIQQVRKEWSDKHIGRVPAATTYQEFLARQSVLFQNEVLGPTRAALFRNGGLKLDQFVDRAGNELNLHDLAATEPEAFVLAGLDPDRF
jgi:hypothetical protein